MKQRKVCFHSIGRSGIALAVLCMIVVVSSGPVLSEVVCAQEPTPAPAAGAASPINISNLVIEGTEKLDRGPYASFAWSPDGTKALVSKARGGHQLYQSQREGALPVEGLWVGVRDLWVVDWAGGQEELLVETAYRWAWSPDGSSVAYIAPVGEAGISGELYVIDLATKSSWRLAQADLVQSYTHPIWLETNEIVYIAGARLWSVQPDGSDLHQLNDLHLSHIIPEGFKDLESYNGNVESFTISPTGKYIAYTESVGVPDSRPDHRYELWLSDLDGQNARVIDENGIERTWSPDGGSLAYLSWPDWENPYASNLAVVDVETGEQRLLYEAPSYLATPAYVIWSPSSDVLAFRERDFALDEGELPALWFVKADGSELRVFRDFEDLPGLQNSREFMTWNKDGRHLLVIPGGAGTPYLVGLNDSP